MEASIVAIPSKLRVVVLFSKADPELGLHAGGGDLQHPGGWIEALLNLGNALYALHPVTLCNVRMLEGCVRR